MKGRGLMLLIAVNLAALLVLAAVYPHLMLSPGPLIAAHSTIDADCQACHTPGRGATSDRCIACHAVADIGVRTTAGAAIQAGTIRVAFHQELIEQGCVTCHAGHLGARASEERTRTFAHTLLQPDARTDCAGCHRRPSNALHRDTTVGCATCHTTEQWEPATFEHARYFVLDRDHDAPCATCHVNGEFARYTCYGCHEHTENNVRRKHEEEGIRDFADCVECHRNARDEPRERRGGLERRR